MKILGSISFFLICLLITDNANSQTQSKYQFEYAEPQEHGFSPGKLDTLSSFLSEAGSSALMLVVDGKIIFEWGNTSKKHTIHSIRKTLVNALYGIKVEEGLIDTNTTIREMKIDDLKSLSENEKDARIADLLKSRSGIYHDAAAVSEGMLRGKPKRDQFKPGEHYYYNNWDFNVLGAILEQQTGQSLYELFNAEVAKPLGMHDYNGTYTSINLDEMESEEDFTFPDTDGYYQYEPDKSNFPAYHFRLSARDMAVFGQLYLNNGSWNGKQLIPEEWIETSTKPYSIFNPDYGIAYGMLWSVLMKTEIRPSKSFYHTGTGIHMLGIYPSSKLVLIHRVDTENPYTFNQGDFYQMIDLVFDAKN